MRYIKFKDPKKMKKTKKREYISNLDNELRAKYIKGKNIELISQITVYILFAIFFVLFERLITFIPRPEGTVLSILSAIGIFICYVLNFILSALIAVIPYILMLRLVPEEHITISNELLKIMSEELRRFYLFSGENCIVTKCYESSDSRFNNKDIVLYKAGDEIRLAVNLKHNFSDPKKDLGCYIFTKDEITVYKTEKTFEISCEGHKFLLGKKAIKFIEEQ